MMLTRGILRAEEVDDFYHTIQLGVLPSSTCLSYRTGSYRECLLAAFDSNKKMILIRQGDEVVGRACLRLTKGGFQKPSALTFGFADLAQSDRTQAVNLADQEQLVLFLERMYTSHLDKEGERRAYQLAVSLVTKKAAGLGATAVLAKCYASCCESDQYFSAPFFVYISKSKNGLQYLDSLGGAAATSDEEKYVESGFMIRQSDEYVQKEG